MSTHTANKDEIAQALQVLEDAVKDRKGDIQELIADKYANVKHFISETQHSVAASLNSAGKHTMDAAIHAKEAGAEKAKKFASDVDANVRESPWPYIGSVALGALLVGYILGKKD